MSTVTFTTMTQCNHANGWYVGVKFFWIFTKQIFVCSDCGQSMSAKELSPVTK